MNRHRALGRCLGMISAQTLRVCREGKPLHTFPDHALHAPPPHAECDHHRRGQREPGDGKLQTDRIDAGETERMIRKSVKRFSEKIMPKQESKAR